MLVLWVKTRLDGRATVWNLMWLTYIHKTTTIMQKCWSDFEKSLSSIRGKNDMVPNIIVITIVSINSRYYQLLSGFIQSRPYNLLSKIFLMMLNKILKILELVNLTLESWPESMIESKAWVDYKPVEKRQLSMNLSLKFIEISIVN